MQSAFIYLLRAYACDVQSHREVIDIELNRLTTRITGLNISRLEAIAPQIFKCSQAVVQLTPPTTKILPSVSVLSAGAQLIVVVNDYLAVNSPENDSEVAALLTQLRRDLP